MWEEETKLYPVGIFGVDIVFDCDMTLLPEIIGRNLHQVGNFGLVKQLLH
jgi:hypothetical protein